MIRNRVKDEETQGINPAWWVTHRSYAKANSDVSELCIANEWVAGHLANFLRLPVPPFALFRSSSHPRRMFASLRFGTKDIPPNDCRPLECVNQNKRLCTGIVAFDILIANTDRHRENIKVDDPVRPRNIWLIDHERALLGDRKSAAVQRLDALQFKLGISNHCLARYLDTAEFFNEWAQAIRFIPWPSILALCNEGSQLGGNKALSDRLYEFLEYRRRNIIELIRQDAGAFPCISNWPST